MTQPETAAAPAPGAPGDRPPSLALTFLLPFLLLTVGGTAFGFAASFLNLSLRLTVTVVLVGAVMLPTCWLYRRYGLSPWAAAAPRWPAPLPLAGLCLFLAGLVVAQDTFMAWVVELVPQVLADLFWELVRAQSEVMDVRGPAALTWYVLLVVAGPAVFEELLFRGLVLRATLGLMPPLPSVALNGVLFAVMHQNPVAFTYYFFLGAVMAYAAMRTGTLVYGMILHAALNLSALVLFRHYGPLIRFPVPEAMSIVAGMGAMAAGLALFMFTEKRRLVLLRRPRAT